MLLLERQASMCSHFCMLQHGMQTMRHSTGTWSAACAQVACNVPVDEPIFQPFPPEVTFHGHEPFKSYEALLYLRNNDLVSMLVHAGGQCCAQCLANIAVIATCVCSYGAVASC